MPIETLLQKDGQQPQLRARCTKKLKRRVKDAHRSTGQDESAIVRVAVEEFFQNHATPQEVISAVVKSLAKNRDAKGGVK